MKITLNGLPYEIDDEKNKMSFSVEDLLIKLKLEPSAVAVELNGMIIKRQDYGATPVSDGDKVEIIRFMSGG